MVSRRWLSVLAAVPVLGLLSYELAAVGQYAPVPQPAPVPQYAPQYTPQYPPQQQPPQQQQPQQLDQQARNELGIELKKAQIQSALAERIAQVKEDARRRIREKAAAGGVDEGQVLEADADAAESRAGAEISKLNTQIVDLQLRNGQPPAQGPLGYGQQPNPTTVQIMQMELKKAQIQTAVSRQIAGIRQRQFERLQQAQNVPPEALTTATLDFESARAMAEVAQLDEQLMASRLQAAGGRP